MSHQELRARIADKRAAIAVVGLGYVGLPVACMFAQAGFHVLGLDLKAERVAAINAGECPIEGDEPGLAELLREVTSAGRLRATVDAADLAQSDVILVAVETPVDADHRPRYTALRAALQSIGAVLKRGALVIVESTIAPGTMAGLVRPVLEETSGLRCNVDFYLGACPERVMPGKLLANLRRMSRVCGGSTPEAAETMLVLYRHIVAAELDAADLVTAELVKTTENAYRDVQIAFANEVAQICELNGADVFRVRELVNKSPYRQMHLPGAGVGGHCIPKDPWLLAYAAGEQLPLRLIPAARAVNDGMPLHMAELTVLALAARGAAIAGARIAVLGYAYLENSDDTRNSPSVALIARLEELGADVVVHDPWVSEYRGDVLDRVAGADAVVLMVAHDEYRALDPDALRNALRQPILVDGRNLFDAGQFAAAGFIYRGVGKGGAAQ